MASYGPNPKTVQSRGSVLGSLSFLQAAQRWADHMAKAVPQKAFRLSGQPQFNRD